MADEDIGTLKEFGKFSRSTRSITTKDMFGTDLRELFQSSGSLASRPSQGVALGWLWRTPLALVLDSAALVLCPPTMLRTLSLPSPNGRGFGVRVASAH